MVRRGSTRDFKARLERNECVFGEDSVGKMGCGEAVVLVLAEGGQSVWTR